MVAAPPAGHGPVELGATDAPGADVHADVSELLACPASPVRVRIIERLVAGEACVHELVDEHVARTVTDALSRAREHEGAR